MESKVYSRRDVAICLVALPAGLTFAGPALAAAESPPAMTQSGGKGISHTAAAIHQEVVFKASRKRVYAALTDAQRFVKVMRQSDAVTLLTAPGAQPAKISRSVGGPFLLFGGYISGQQVELLADQRIVQVWRTAGWAPDEYSIARFALADEGSGTRLTFDQKGFPESEAEHLAQGWYAHYWDPLEKYLAQEGH